MRLTKTFIRDILFSALLAASLLLALSIDGVVTSAQSGFEGDYDLGFGTNGYYVDPENPDPTVDEFATVFITGDYAPDGSIIAGGRLATDSNTVDFYLRKFTPTGAVDTSFGSSGMVRTNFHSRYDGVPTYDTPNVLKVQPDGKILFAGACPTLEPNAESSAFGPDACVLRYNANGTLDQTFGGNLLVYNADSTTKTFNTQIDPGKLIFQTGLIADGHSFGTGGVFHDIAVQPDGKIVLVGETRNYDSYHAPRGTGAIVVRLNPNGSLDSTFGAGGIARWNATQSGNCFPERRFLGVRLQPDGRIIAVGHDGATSGESCFQGQFFAVTRWTSSGQLETVRRLDASTDTSQHERAVSAHFTRDGSKLIVSGAYKSLRPNPSSRLNPTLVRLNVSNLSLDTTFGSGGIAQYNVGTEHWQSSTLYVKAVQPDGKILGSDNADVYNSCGVVRFNSDGSADQSFGNLSIDASNVGLGRLRLYVTTFNGDSAPLAINAHVLQRPNGRINLLSNSSWVLRGAVTQQNTELPTYTLAGRVLNGAGVGVGGVTVNLSGTQSASKVTDASGNYSFAGLPMGGNYTVAPAKAGLTFVPASKSLANLSADQLSVNFSAPSLSVNNVTITEGNAGETTATFAIKLLPASTQPVTVKYATANSTALAPGDYTALPLTPVTFEPGQTSKTVAVKVKGDALDEANETFRLLLSAPAGALISDNEGVCTITDNDAPPSLKVNNVAVTEGNAAVTATFTVSLSAASAQTVTVKYQTSNGTATAPADYTAKALTTLTFSPFQTSKTVTVTIAGDTRDEPTETFKLLLSAPTRATIAVGTGTCTVTDNDPAPSITVTNAAVTEPDTGSVNAVFTVKLSAASGQTVTVKYATANGTAAAGSDYTALALSTLTFSPGQTSKTVSVTVRGDVVKESNETFFLNLSAVTNAALADSQGQGTITNDD